MKTSMAGGSTTRITDCLREDGTLSAEELLPLVYDELRGIAARAMKQERAGHTLQSTALVHEAYARLVGNDELTWDNRAHFFTAAAEAMRRILVEHARARNRIKRGGPDKRQVPLTVVELVTDGDSSTFLSLERAFRRLLDEVPEMGEVARLRLFAGLGVQEIARALEISPATVKRRWTYAKAWLQRAIAEESDDGPETGS